MDDSEDEGEEEVIDPEEFEASIMDENNDDNVENVEHDNNDDMTDETIDKAQKTNNISTSNEHSSILPNKNSNTEQPEDTALPTEDSPNPN